MVFFSSKWASKLMMRKLIGRVSKSISRIGTVGVLKKDVSLIWMENGSEQGKGWGHVSY